MSVALAILQAIPLSVHADLFKSFKTDGSIEIKSFGIDNESDRNGTRDDYRSETRTRILAGATFDILDDVHGRFLLRKNNRLYGQPVENLNSTESAFALDNAYIKIDKVFTAIDMTMGRQFYTSPEDFVIDYSPYEDDLLTVNSIDLFRADTSIGNMAHIQGIAGKANETTPVSTTIPAGPLNNNTDTDVFGGSVESDMMGPMANAAVFYYTRKNKFAKPPAAGNDTLNVTGAKVSGEVVAGLSYRLDFMQNFGRNNAAVGQPSYNGTAYFAGLHFGRTMEDWGVHTAEGTGLPVRAILEYGRGTDNFRSISVGPRFGKIWGEHINGLPPAGAPSVANRFAPYGGLNNIKVIHGSVGASPLPQLSFDAHWYRFRYDAPVGLAGLTSAGTEYDFIAGWKHSENVSLEASIATFQVGDALANPGGTPTNPITRIGSDIRIKF